MQEVVKKFKQYPVLFVNIIFTIFCMLFPLSAGIQVVWFLMWIIVPIFMNSKNSFCSITYMSLYMRVQYNVRLFSIIVCASFFIILIKKLLNLNKNKLLNKYFKILIFYLFLVIIPLFYSIFANKLINISFIYYLNMVNLLFLFYLLKSELNKNLILIYCYGLIFSSALSIITYCGSLHPLPFNSGNRFCAFMPLCNSLGACCVIGISSLYVLLINKQLNIFNAISLMVSLSLIGLITLSKTFFITFGLVLLIIFIRQFKICNNKKKFIKYCLIVLLLLSPFILYYLIIMLERFLGDGTYSNVFDIITTGRLDKWLIYLKPWAKHFYSVVFGLGLCFDYNTVYSSHSLFVGYLSKMGIVGIVSILAFVYLIVFNKNKCNFKLKYLPIIMALLICFVEDMSYNTFVFVPFIIGIVCTWQNIRS